jgi:uncharacterized protein (TIGR02145 family)
MNYLQRYFGYFIFILSGILSLSAQSISSVDHFQEGQHIRIVYELQTSTPVEIQVFYSKDFGKTFSSPLKQVSGAVGKGITAGSKEILWRVLDEVPDLVGEGIVFRVSIAGAEWRPGMVHCNNTPTEIVEVRNPITGRVWMDRNLGASRAASSSTDEAAYGDLYQWGRFGDGHQCRSSGIVEKLSSNDMPGHGKFIVAGSNRNNDWRSSQNINLWQGGTGINNPCPLGFRIPTDAEWESEQKSWFDSSSAGSIKSTLKLPLGGNRLYGDGWISLVGVRGTYWSSSVSGPLARYLLISSSNTRLYAYYRGNGLSVRCIKD